MSDLDFEVRLGAQVRGYAEGGIRPVDRYAIAEAVIGGGAARTRRWWAIEVGRRVAVPIFVGLLLLALVATALLVGSRPTVPAPLDSAPRVLIASGDQVRCLNVDALSLDGAAPKRVVECANRLAISGDGRRIAVGGDHGLTIVGADGATLASVDAGGGSDFPIAWSPGGHWLQWSTESYDVSIGTPGGSSWNHLPVLAGGGYNGSFLWSPDDRRFYLRDDTGWLVGQGDGSSLAPAPFAADIWAISPDGNLIAQGVSRKVGGNGEAVDLGVIHADGSGLRTLTTFPAGTSAHFAAWSPDGRTIVVGTELRNADGTYQGAKDPPGQLWVVGLDGSARRVTLPTDLTGVEAYDGGSYAIRWAPDSSAFTVQSGVSLQPGSSQPASSVDTYVVSRSGSLIAVLGDASMPAWSPDGHLLAFVGGTGSAARTQIANPDGSSRREVGAAPSGDFGQLVWAP